MGVYINGMDMPTTHEVVVHILPDGTASIHDIAYTQAKETVAVEVPKHVRLIDANAFEVVAYKDTEGRANTFDEGVMWLSEQIDNAPTVIERED